ncbi:MAG: 1-phosphofructokinase [Oscillospiraceae bacterium]|nr:1-phosphofructokinase [Oscillospiraceae bacterium]
MIYTVTFNPSIDYAIITDGFTLGGINRTMSETILAGGKGINVSTVLHNLGCESVALGFTAGFTGGEIERLLDRDGVKSDFISLKNGMSRINVKLKDKEETEINGSGPEIDSQSLNALMTKLSLLREGDYLVLAGSIPSTLPDTVYLDIMQMLSGKGVNIIVDASKNLLLNVLPQKPFLIKPNNIELSEMFGVTTLYDKDEIISYAKKLQDMGARNVLVSMAGDGAVFVSENGLELKSEAPAGVVINSVGAGDSMVAGFIAGYIENGDFEKAFRLGIASGSASTFSRFLATSDEIYAILTRLEENI